MKKTILIVLIAVLGIGTITAQIPSNYFDAANGQSGYTLKTTLHNLIKNHTQRTYDQLWTDFKQTDNKGNNVVWDMYSDGAPYNFSYTSDQCGTYTGEGGCYNREHSFPKSWFNEGYPMYTDLFHLYPTDGYVNGRRSNYPFGEVSNPTWTAQNGSKLGACSYPGYTGTVFEPIDEFKGDFARTYFYMATCYQNVISGWSSPILDGSTDKVYVDWTLNLLLEWNANDPVSQKEIDRNNAVYGIQGNANPFISHPEYVNLIWGGQMPENVPYFTSYPVTDATANTAYSYTVTAAHATASNLTFTTTTKPSWASFTDNGNKTATLQGTPTTTGTYNVVIKVSDGTNITEQSFTITVGAQATTGEVILTEGFESNGQTSYYTGDIALTSGTWHFTQVYRDYTENTGLYSVRINDDVADAGITTPSLNSVGNVSFYYRALNSESAPSTFKLQKSVNGGAFVTVDSHQFQTNVFAQYSFDVNESSSNVKIRVLNNNQAGHLLIDDFEVKAYGGTTPPPINNAPVFASSALTTATQNQAYSYTASANDTDGDALSFTATTKPSWATLTNNGNGTATLSGTPTTAGNYNVVLSVSDGEATATQNFTIVVEAEVTTINYCVSQGNSSSYEWISSVKIGDQTNSSNAAGYTDFTSYAFSLNAGGSYAITLTPGFASSAYNEYWKIWIDYNKDGDFNDAGEAVFDQGGMSQSAVSATINIDGSAYGETRMRISMKYNGGPTTCEAFSYGEVEDYTVVFTEGVSCNAPTALATSNITETSAKLSWNAAANASSYKVEYKKSSISTWTTKTTTSTSYTLNGLAAGTSYDWKVSTVCSSGVSTAANGQAFTTQTSAPIVVTYCTSQGNNANYEWIAGVKIGSFTNTSGSSKYTDYTNTTVSLAPGASYNVNLTPGFSGSTYNEYWRIWIDYNHDGDFNDNNELVFDAGSLSKTTVSGSFTALSTATGTTRMRVSMKYNGSQTSCESFSYGEVEDYTVNFGTAKALVARIIDLGKEVNVSTYPNPAQDYLKIEATENIEAVIYLFDAAGKLIMTENMNTMNTTLNVSGLNNGMYFIRINDGKQLNFQDRIIIQK